MNAQELDYLMEKFHKDKTVQLSDKLSIYQEKVVKNDTLYWTLCLKKEGERETKLLDKAETLYLGEDTFMHTPNLIDAYMEGKYLYVFIYKDYKAMLEIYYFKDGVKFEKTGYLLCPIESGSVMNFGLYTYYVDIKEIGEYHYVSYYVTRPSVIQGFGLLRIKENNVSKIKEKKDSEKNIFYPYRRIKEIKGDVPETDRKTILFKEFKNLVKEHNLLAPNALIYSAGYINDAIKEWIYYIFYKTTDSPNEIKLIKYGNYLNNNRPGFGWLFCDYTEEALAPEYSHWNPK
ncbi:MULTISPECIES: hypothetical protein [unclassified Treponema]|uniref:hypothetical protein n=1 Tax=unclassified Treponema TaxID=2638727 RepID=UPI0020A538F3|nr:MULTISPECIES: hypothetical protein [unclassified Treponema]UTC66610.1 hypothetical protein E4O06_11720 [Treponema sp. OMZ 789]UTC69342.1 hypothetical protein E4O01_11860 [Treponema sp. OMZ 790]UTC72057.1 hypothetical protein E4O02_11955 [Treponema sp. OMZ 791]